ncbi:hypothetical protein [Rhodocista pekingensis]|uniref:TonB-dependent receptor n=1 Tax=Rhodocista pekingensis TaxID=201185 RepID=A0ABW2L0X4_9PROT
MRDRVGRVRRLAASVVLPISLLACQGTALAQDGGAQPGAAVPETVSLDLPAQPLHEALQAFSRQTGIPLTILPDTPSDVRSTAVSGRMSPDVAVGRLLAGRDVPFRFAEGALIVGRGVAAGDTTVQVLDPVRVVGIPEQFSLPAGETGATVIGRELIGAMGTPNRDPMRLLRATPNVVFADDLYAVGNAAGNGTLTEQDLSPARISISGGKDYDNKYLIDGLDNGSIFDVTETNEAHADHIGIHNPLALFTNADLLDEIAIYDSNVPVRYSGFTGGVVSMKLRAPRDVFGGSASISHQRDSWVDYHYEWETPDATAEAPKFKKTSYDALIDIPLLPGLRSMVGASYVEAEQDRVRTANYDDGTRPATKSTSATYLAGISADLSEALVLDVKGLYSPYTQEYTRWNMANDRQETTKDAYQVNGDLRYTGSAVTAKLTAGYSLRETERDAPDTAYTWRRTGSKTSVCAGGTQCVEGGYGDIADRQENVEIKGEAATTFLTVDWSAGFDFNWTEGTRKRDDEAVHYFSPTVSSAIVCADPNDPGCIAGEQVLTRRNFYPQRDYSADVSTYGLWLQADRTLEVGADYLKSIDLRAGLRADYGDFWENLNWSPRLSTTFNLPADVGLTLAAGRYYGTDTLVYAFYARDPAVVSETRVAASRNVYRNEWVVTTPSYPYMAAEVDTPYSDELTAALTFPLLWGEGRAKYIDRDTRDDIAMELASVDGRTVRRPTNNGRIDYRSVSLEWVKTLDNHAFMINGTWSDTDRNILNYLATPDDEGTTNVYYEGRVVSRGDLSLIADTYGQPVTINAVWTADWFDDRLSTNVTGKYRFSHDEIVATDKTIRVNNSTYYIYEKRTNHGTWRFDLNAVYRIETWTDQHLDLTLTVENLLDSRTYTADASAPYERGRAFWLGAGYRF